VIVAQVVVEVVILIVLDQIVQLLMGVVKIRVMPLIPIDRQELE
jgi:hypothetical protein